MKEQLATIRAQALAAFEAAQDSAALDALRVQYLGKKGELTGVLKQMGKLSPEERPAMGALANEVRAALEDATLHWSELCRFTLPRDLVWTADGVTVHPIGLDG